mgnify:CR=1 FL=1
MMPPSPKEVRESKPYRDGFAWALADSRVREALGEPITDDIPGGGLSDIPGLERHAVLSGLLRGPKGVGVLKVRATGVPGANGEWEYLEVTVRLEDGTVVDLQSEEHEEGEGSPAPNPH